MDLVVRLFCQQSLAGVNPPPALLALTCWLDSQEDLLQQKNGLIPLDQLDLVTFGLPTSVKC